MRSISPARFLVATFILRAALSGLSPLASAAARADELTGQPNRTSAKTQPDQRSPKASIIAYLDAAPDLAGRWRQLNIDPQFLNWLDQVDPLSGKKRQLMLNDAYTKGDVQSVAAFFRLYIKSLGDKERGTFGNWQVNLGEAPAAAQSPSVGSQRQAAPGSQPIYVGESPVSALDPRLNQAAARAVLGGFAIGALKGVALLIGGTLLVRLLSRIYARLRSEHAKKIRPLLMPLKPSQKIICFGMIAAALMLLFPPWQSTLRNGQTLDFGYGLLFSPPTPATKYYLHVDIALFSLSIEALVVVVLTALAWFVQSRREQAAPPGPH
jgi:hypothetical protein